MFIGELPAILFHKCAQPPPESAIPGLLDSEIPPPMPFTSHLKIYGVIGAIAGCDLLSTAMINLGLLYLSASVWQMLRGAMIVFSAILQFFALKRKRESYMWWGVCIVIFALAIVGLATVFSNGIAAEEISNGTIVLAVALTIGGQFLRAVQVVSEDYFLHDIALSPYFIVGIEGAWGIIGSVCIFLPVVQVMGGDEGNGVHEDSIDTLKMLGNLPLLIGLSVVYVVLIFGLNVCGMMVTEITSATMRTIIESMRTLCIWVVQIILYYALLGSQYGNHHPGIGEEWSAWSWMQLAGFGLLVTGMFVYNKMVRLPWVAYVTEQSDLTEEGGRTGKDVTDGLTLLTDRP
jgi:drug/metabolite transporter (DMT)-like permease